MTTTAEQWAQDWNIPQAALDDLRLRLGAVITPEFKHGPEITSETGVMQQERLKAAQAGAMLMRNNNGALTDKRDVPVRFGLGNDSSAANKVCKSSDLIGWISVKITPEMVGSTIAQFCAVECKEPGWTYKATEREVAQLNFLKLVMAAGGQARFAS